MATCCMKKKETLFDILLKVSELRMDIETAEKRILRLFSVRNRFSPEQMAEWFHNNYEEIAKAEGWKTQDKCRVEFKDLPENNKITMIKVCERWLTNV